MADSTSNEPRGGCCGCALLTLLGLLLIGGAIFFVLPRVGLELPGGWTQSSGIGKRLATIDLVSLGDDREVVTPQDLEGKVVLLNFWGTWCPPCRLEIAEIAEIENRFGSQPDFRLLAVSCGQGVSEDVGQLRIATNRFLQQTGLNVPCYADPDVLTRNAVDQAAGFSVYPTTLILDRKGVIRGMWTGYSKGAGTEMERLIEGLLKEKAVPPDVVWRPGLRQFVAVRTEGLDRGDQFNVVPRHDASQVQQ